MDENTQCPCSIDRTFAECCEPYLTGVRQAETAERLMRSRYTAFCRSDFQYLKHTHHSSTTVEYEKAADVAGQPQWTGLEVVQTDQGGQNDTEGWVDFIARFRAHGNDQAMREKSHFVKEAGLWLYVDGKYLAVKYSKTATPGRNDPCPCGSGKKYKKCCGQ